LVKRLSYDVDIARWHAGPQGCMPRVYGTLCGKTRPWP